MNELQVSFVQYIKEYVQIITDGQEEFFISLCDIEEELLEELDILELNGYTTVVVGNRDYSKAIRLRNDINVQKIVLLSGEGVKHIDSLKDFNEFSVLNEERSIVWRCLEEVFGIELNRDVRNFLEAILNQGEISLWELLQYLNECIEGDRYIAKRMNEKLPMLGIWKSNEGKILNKGKISRIIRFSKYGALENRLTKAIMDGKISKPTWERTITNSLSQGSVQKILEGIYYEDASDWLKTPINMPAAVNIIEESPTMDSWHGFSYEYKLQEHMRENITVLEKEWLEERNDEGTDLEWDHYQPLRENVDFYEKQIEHVIAEIDDMILPPSEKERLTEKVKTFEKSFVEAWDGVLEATPMCLDTFCVRAEEYTTNYMELLTMILTNHRIRTAVSGIDLVNNIQTLLCEKEPDKIRMPYYHPICIFYYMSLRKMYEEVIQGLHSGSIREIQEMIYAKLIQKIGIQFPIDMLICSEKEGDKYALDHATVWQSSAVEFVNISEGFTYSILDFRIVQNQILEYLSEHPFLSVITVALVDISDLEGIEQLAYKIQKLADGDRCNIGRVEFLILSAKEEGLKKKLTQIKETFELKGMIYFRFGGNSYKINNEYDTERIVNEADMTIFADSSILYQAPRMEKIQEDSNVISNRLENINLEEQIEEYYENGASDISVMWATLQHAAESRGEGLWKWKSREIDNKMLSFCNHMVDIYADKEIVALSSSKSILSEIFMPKNMHAYRRKYNGKSVTIISLSSINKEEKLPIEGDAQISYSLNSFYETELDLQEVTKQISSYITDIQLIFYYKDNSLWCDCSIDKEEMEEAADAWKDMCVELLKWQLGDFFQDDNIFSNYLSELLIYQWHEKTDCFPAVLMVERLCKDGYVKLQFDERKRTKDRTTNNNTDNLEAITTHEMLYYIASREAIDEETIHYFRERYGEELLNKVLMCDNDYHLLRKEERNMLDKIQKGIRAN